MQTKVLGAMHPRRPESRRRTRSKVSPATSHVPCCTYVLLPSTPAHGGTLRDTPQLLCTAITAVAAARTYHSAVTFSRRRACNSRHIPATLVCLLAHGRASEPLLGLAQRRGQNSAYRKAASYPLATKPGQESLIPARRGCWTRAGRSLGSVHVRALSILSETYKHACRRRSTAPRRPLASGSKPWGRTAKRAARTSRKRLLRASGDADRGRDGVAARRGCTAVYFAVNSSPGSRTSVAYLVGPSHSSFL